MAPIPTAVIGYGLSARVFHIPFLLSLPQLFTLTAILQRNPSTSSPSASTDHPTLKIHTQQSTLISDPSIALVVITTPPSTHFELARDALKAGKHVLVEKPFVPSAREAAELAALARETGKVLSVYQNRRWDADFVTLAGLVRAGTLGRVVEVQSQMDRYRPEGSSAKAWKADASLGGNGAIYDLGTHLVDQAVALFGMPVRVTGLLGRQRDGVVGGEEVEVGGADSFTVVMYYEGGMLYTAKAGVLSAMERQVRFWARGTKGSFMERGEDPQEAWLKDGGKVGDENFGRKEGASTATLDTVGDDGAVHSKVYPLVEPPPTYGEYYRKLAEAINGQAPAPVTADQAEEVLHIIELAIESSKTWRSLKVGS